MNIVVLTQVYFPDTVSVAQHLADLCKRLEAGGHSITVITSRFGYDSRESFEKFEVTGNITVKRVWQTNFGKKSFLLRALNFLSFNFSLMVAALLLRQSKVDCIVGTTSPPFSALVGIILSKLKRAPFCFWVMDLQPELSIASGIIEENSYIAKFFTALGNFAIRSSTRIISLDRFMTAHLVSRGGTRSKISEIPVWPVNESVYRGLRLDNPFRIQNHFGEKIVVMFSGNHAHVHPMDTLLEASKILRSDDSMLFAFVGGGVRREQVSQYKNKYALENVVQFPFQPRSIFHISIAASDIQVVIMGSEQVGYTHPNKIYGAMFLGKPILYIGPKKSHVADILGNVLGNISVQHGDVERLVEELKAFSKLDTSEVRRIGDNNRRFAEENFNPNILIDKMAKTIEESMARE